MLLNTESEASCIGKVLLFEFAILNLESTLEDFVGLITSDSDVNGDLLITLDAEASNSETSARWDGLLPGKVLKNLACFIIGVVPLVSLSPDSPTLMFNTNFSMRTSLIGFSFSASGFLATFLLIDGYKYRQQIKNNQISQSSSYKLISYKMNSSLKMEEGASTLRDAVSPKYIAHYSGQIRNSLFLDLSSPKEGKLIFPAANTIVLNTLSASFENEKVQSFLNTLQGSKGITTLAQSLNRRFIAWSQQTSQAPVIFVMDLVTGKKKNFASSEIKGNKFISIAFNGTQNTDPKLLIALTSGPEYQVVQWNFEKLKFTIHALDKTQKIDKQSNLAVDRFNQVFFYREDDTIVAMGRGNLKFFKLASDKIQLKDSPFARREINQKDFNFTAYCILKDGLIVGTDSGDLLYFAINGEFKAVLASSPGENYTIQTILYLPNSNKSFVVAGSDGLLYLYDKAESKQAKNLYVRSDRKLSLNEFKGRVTSLLTTPKQDLLFVGLNTGIILKVSLDKNEEHSCEHALQSFHTETITGLDVCLRKSLVATCSSDRTVRIWNYLQKNNLQMVKVFQQKPLSLSFHPSGLHLLVSFPDKVRIINILDNELVNLKDLSIKNCYEVKFSHGGHLFAVVNNVMVQLFNFYTLDQPPHYQFKAQAGKFQTMTWEQDDLAVYLGTSDGFVFYYKLQDPNVRLQVLASPGFSVRTLACLFTSKDQKLGTINQRTVYIGGTFNASISKENKCIYEVKITPKTESKQRETVKEDLIKYNISQPSKIFTNANVSKILLINSKKVFIYCTEEKDELGSLRYCKYPLNLSKQIYEIQSHRCKITKVAITYDDNYIFSCGQDGSFICYDFRDSNSKTKLQMPDLSEQFLYSKFKLLELKSLQEGLKVSNAEQKDKKQKSNKQTKQLNDRLINELNYKISDRERVEKLKYDKEVDEINRMEKEQIQKLSKLQLEHKNKRETVEKDYADKIQLQQTRFSELGKMKQAENKKFNQIIQTIKNTHIKKKQQKEIQFEQELNKEKELVRQNEETYEEKKKQYEGDQQKCENEAEKQIKVKKQENQSVIKVLEESNNKAENEKLAKKRVLEKQERALQQQKHKLKHTLEDIQKIKQKHEENLQRKQSQAKQIQERQKTIRDKVTRINELKKKTQELEKFKFVLDYKIKQLKRDIGPREQEIAKMRQQIANMNSQIIHFKGTNDNMNLIVKDLVSKRNGMQKEVGELNQDEGNNVSYIRSFEYDVSDMYQNFISDYKGLKSKVIELYRKYVQEENKKQMEGIDQQKEFIKERAHLQSTVKGLKEKFKKSIELHQADNKRIMSQNEELISEINDLKREKKNLKEEYKKRELQKDRTIRLHQERQQTQLLYEKLVKEYNHLLESEKKFKKKNQPLQV